MLYLDSLSSLSRFVSADRLLRRQGASCAVFAALVAVASACGNSDREHAVADSESAAAVAKANAVIAPDTATRTLAYAAGKESYRVDSASIPSGTIMGHVRMNGALPVDSMITPNRDSTGCRPFQDVTLPVSRESARDTADVAIANAIVWLVGVTHGPATSFSRRVSIVLDGCHFEPRVLVAPVGATIIASNRDEMIAEISFVDHGFPATLPREEIDFTDPGQVVPSSKALAKPGLLEVRDAKHSWVRGFVAVAPHPFVFVTGTDGDFAFEGVPTGAYQLVVWHERLGAKVVPVRVEQGIATVLTATFGDK